MIQN
jgi:hypothetical protein